MPCRAAFAVVIGFAIACGSGCATTPNSCDDGRQDDAETAADCGGPICQPCKDGLTCLRDSDCMNGHCTTGVCQAPASCSDGVANESESDVDCGGPCAGCADGRTCNINGDCASTSCIEGRCGKPSCFDQRIDGRETDIDCGGPVCPPCDPGQACAALTDCVSGQCAAGRCFTHCSDGQRDADESDVDCGGGTCPQCAEHRACKLDSDCLSSTCSGGVCAPIDAFCEPGYHLDPIAGCICDPRTCGSCCDVNEGNVCGVARLPGGNNCGSAGQVCFRCDASKRLDCEHGERGDYCVPACEDGPCAGCCTGPRSQMLHYCLRGDEDAACGTNGTHCVGCPVGQHCVSGKCQ